VIDAAKECPGECIHVVRPADDVEFAGPGAGDRCISHREFSVGGGTFRVR
jgi:hypothetical protein